MTAVDRSGAKDRRARCTHYGLATASGHQVVRNQSHYGQRGVRTCAAEEPSSALLPQFESRPGEPFDRFYCGCWGWS